MQCCKLVIKGNKGVLSTDFIGDWLAEGCFLGKVGVFIGRGYGHPLH
jgi:hypothetical protein